MVLASIGYAGTINDAQWAKIARLLGDDYCYDPAEPLAFTQPNTGIRRLSLNTAGLFGHGVLTRITAAENIDFPLPSGNTAQWYLLVLRRTWATKTDQFVVLPHTTMAQPGSAGAPWDTPTTYPASRINNPGVQDDQPVAWVFGRTDVANLYWRYIVPQPSQLRIRQRPNLPDLDQLAIHNRASALTSQDVWIDATRSYWYWEWHATLPGDVPGAWRQRGPAKFANAAERDAEFAKASTTYRVQGARAYLLDKKWMTVYTGSRWIVEGGLVPIRPGVSGSGVTLSDDGSVAFTAAGAPTLLNCFTDDFDTYKVIIDVEGRTVGTDTFLRWAVAGLWQTDSVYARRGLSTSTATAINGESVNSASSLQLDNGGISTGSSVHIELEIANPALAGRPITGVGKSSSWASATNGWMQDFSFTYWRNAVIDGLTIFPAGGGVISGRLQVFGYGYAAALAGL